jgi:tetratricopeptide (TPR) repeat protein
MGRSSSNQLRHLTKQIAESPNNYALYFRRGRLLASERNYPAALDDLSAAVSLKPQSYRLHFFRGQIYQSLGFVDDAVSDFSACISLKPDSHPAYFARASVLAESGSTSALADFAKAIRLSPSIAHYYYARADYLFQSYELDAAIVDYDRAVALAPDNPPYLTARAYVHFCRTTDNLIDAQADIDSACQLAPLSTWNRYLRGVFLVCDRNWREALEDFLYMANHEISTAAVVSANWTYVCQRMLHVAGSEAMLRDRIMSFSADAADNHCQSEIEEWPIWVSRALCDEITVEQLGTYLESQIDTGIDLLAPYSMLFVALKRIATGDQQAGASLLSSIRVSTRHLFLYALVSRLRAALC